MAIGLGILHRGPGIKCRLETALELLQLLDLRLVLDDPSLNDFPDHRARGIAVTSLPENIFDLGERET